ncbi:protein phosphatase 1 regulatory subunit 32 isoform X2 [Sceloporus undulatus]|uniref:protein phosphatase 1 regulatory subunit 32 isoform X2 n=1 Tax=Sceloporus undulatus TaxID=8520 RepID=UPI001C4DB215|nr:protein phosphatase 1 regulatory subunit 32 isoform X2 [Sceloporus undulatus]
MHATVKFLTSLKEAFPFFEGGISSILPSTSALTETGKSYLTTSPSVSSEKMGRLPLGVVSPYVKTSSGGSVDPMKFYCTSYGTAYGQEGFRPRNAFHSGAGYKSNYRPVVQYKPSLDKLDNPAIGKLLKDNYESTTTKHFQPLQLPDGKYPLPWSVYQPGSGYVREKPVSFPTTKAVKQVHFDTTDQGAQAITGLEPKHTPDLHKSQGRGSIEVENARHGPHYMSTEYGSKFRFNIPGQPDFLQKKTIGAKEETGFTEGCLTNPILDKTTAQGDEFLPVLSKGSERGSGFSRQNNLGLGTAAAPPGAEVSGPLSHAQFQGLQRQPRTQTSLLGREYVGNKEPTGFSLNNHPYVTPAYDPDHPNRFLTSYNSKFYENIPKGVDREGWTRGGIQPQQAGGFATNNHATDLGTHPNATETLRTVHPHVGRTITTVDPFYRDSPHDRRFTALHRTTSPN